MCYTTFEKREPRVPLALLHNLRKNVLSLPAVDEQNAQTQEQQGFVLGLSESEKKDLKTDNRVCTSSAHSESCVVAKGRSQRKGMAGLWFGGYLVSLSWTLAGAFSL